MPHTLLLADDSVTIQRVIELTFADEDIRVVAVGDGDQAIAAIDKAPPDVVLADVGMPGRTGYEVAEHIRRTPRLAHIPVVLLTGAFEPIDQARIGEARCDGVLAKPFEPQLVIGLVKELLARPKEVPSPSEEPHATVPQPAPARGPADEGTSAPTSPPISGRSLAEDVDSYFERLDNALSSVAGGGAEVRAAPPVPVPEQIDWFSTAAPARPAAAEPAASAAAAPQSSASSSSPLASPLAPAALTSLADAFAALLAAERSSAAFPSAPWPAPHTATSPATDARLADEVVDDLVRRVVERLSDRVVRELAPDIVSQVAERLVKEEIDRIKSS